MLSTIIAEAASASAAFQGQWFSVAILTVNGLGVLSGIVFLFATKRELDAQIKRIDQLEQSVAAFPARMNEMERHLAEKGSHRARTIFEKIDKVESGIREEMSATRRELDTKLEQQTQKIVGLLKDTGAIE